MTDNAWTRWPSREALGREPTTRPRRLLGWVIRSLVLAMLLWGAFNSSHVRGWGVLGAVAGILLSAFVAWALFRTTLAHRLWPSLLLFGVLLAIAVAAQAADFGVVALVLWCGCAVTALERLPMAAALPVTVVALALYAAVNDDVWLTTLATTAGLALAGYVLRLDAEARGNAQRLLSQERAARAAEAETAALAERARIAREIHDVLAHSLSAQLVHLEAARLLIEGGAERDQILERVVAARGMARDGLAETRQALSALRGDMTPLEEFLNQLVGTADGAETTISGERRPLSAEASQAVRRVAQEALTNVRKHAPGAKVRMLLEYGEEQVTLVVRDSGGSPGELTTTGGGYGLLGMRERAELLGGSLHAGPDDEGFVVTLKVPV
ncbi:signal transduction histidine kinase [Streptomyces sp. SAI-208]|uniref:sensor histidine kinase n=1 Tax=unclassified Streptomyces TaxID=2593676 RepID=UPI0024768E4E|nr:MULTISPECIES: histidine kinase [unclassified Streptomyces]MDH6515987.1 signal transduction histidine kinase [Streptomyces sp. SAI-090]MDH6548200.1 signal transduction histidine kinase [Streptomyces sp. SAI-041]MDH6567292.1 signal transduction histidine kinase [Streptomyces sp. SAI-117]MDH6587776.1 signal transduction histidine kinase [Streptomyces sp. SAI-133]MDH6606814.1 signal transduction histidine kinase [Streptomyces sp. SAI-208]